MAIEWRTVPRGQSLGLLESTLKSKNRLGAVLAGSAGVGKTVLARHAVDRFAQRHGSVSVQWLAGTASARQIPFGAFSHLVDVAGVGDSPTLLRSARASLLQHGGQGLLLAIDDAHHLDNLSATLVHQLALTGSARFVITVRAGEQAPDAITSLWKDRLLDRLDIEPFDAAQTKSLLEAVLGGPMETSSADAVFTASQGNPLYLRHLAESAIGSGALRQVDGVWQLRGHIGLSAELSALIGRHLEALPPTVTSVLEYLAVEEPLSLRDLTELAGREALEEAEDQRVIEVVKRGDDLVVHSAHPLYAEQVRASLGQIATRRLRTQLVAQLSSKPIEHVSARLRLAALAIESDTPPPVDDVVTSSWEAMRLGDLLLGERLAQSALDRSGGLTARLPLAHALSWLGRGPDADQVLTPVDPDTPFGVGPHRVDTAEGGQPILDARSARGRRRFPVRDARPHFGTGGRRHHRRAGGHLRDELRRPAARGGDRRRGARFTCQPGPRDRLGGGDRDAVECAAGQVRRRRPAGRTRPGGGTSGAAAVHHRAR